MRKEKWCWNDYRGYNLDNTVRAGRSLEFVQREHERNRYREPNFIADRCLYSKCDRRENDRIGPINSSVAMFSIADLAAFLISRSCRSETRKDRPRKMEILPGCVECNANARKLCYSGDFRQTGLSLNIRFEHPISRKIWICMISSAWTQARKVSI